MFSNLEYLYNHLPTRFRREDKDLFLKRYLQFFGETLDEYDAQFDLFFENINPATASEIWIEFWLKQLFGWSWFPKWFTLADKRNLYANFAKHLARRGTAKGIELWLKDFSLIARVYTKPKFYGESCWGEENFATTELLLIAVEIIHAEPRESKDMVVCGESCYGEAFYARNEPLFTTAELVALLRYVQPDAQEILLIQKSCGSIVQSLLRQTLSAMTLTNHAANVSSFDESTATPDDLIAAIGTIMNLLGANNRLSSGLTSLTLANHPQNYWTFDEQAATPEDIARAVGTIMNLRGANNGIFTDLSGMTLRGHSADTLSFDAAAADIDDLPRILGTILKLLGANTK